MKSSKPFDSNDRSIIVDLQQSQELVAAIDQHNRERCRRRERLGYELGLPRQVFVLDDDVFLTALPHDYDANADEEGEASGPFDMQDKDDHMDTISAPRDVYSAGRPSPHDDEEDDSLSSSGQIMMEMKNMEPIQ